jgi:dolichol-phosphate mannosyltransferase
MLPILRGGTDICFTAYSDDHNHNGRVTSRMFHRLSSYLTGARTSNNTATMRGFNRNVLGAILKYGERRPVYGPLIAGLGFTSETLVVELPSRKGHISSYTFGKRLRLAGDYLIGYTNIPSTFFMAASGLAFLGTLIYSAAITFQYLFMGRQFPPGISLMIVLMLLMFSILFLGIAIVGLYLKRLLEETLSRPLYVVAATHRLDSLPKIRHRPD